MYPTLYAEYKVKRINEMACIWKGKPHEDVVVPMLAMLLIECGKLSEDCRGDYGAGGYYAIGISQHHICQRTTFDRRYCYWKDGKHPEKQVAERYPEFAGDWRSQFYQYSDVIRAYIEEGLNADQMIRRWNPGEAGRRTKVEKKEEFVRMAIL